MDFVFRIHAGVPFLKCVLSFFFFFNDTATTEIYTLSLHDALPISRMPSKMPCSNRGATWAAWEAAWRSEEHTSELQSHSDLVCRLLLEKKKDPGDAHLGANFLSAGTNCTGSMCIANVKSVGLSAPETMMGSQNLEIGFFFFNDTATTEIYTLSLHDALPISDFTFICPTEIQEFSRRYEEFRREKDRKSTRLNSSHTVISYAVFCLKKKN